MSNVNPPQEAASMGVFPAEGHDVLGIAPLLEPPEGISGNQPTQTQVQETPAKLRPSSSHDSEFAHEESDSAGANPTSLNNDDGGTSQPSNAITINPLSDLDSHLAVNAATQLMEAAQNLPPESLNSLAAVLEAAQFIASGTLSSTTNDVAAAPGSLTSLASLFSIPRFPPNVTEEIPIDPALERATTPSLSSSTPLITDNTNAVSDSASG
jgi:hypothetical protein